MFNKWFGLIIPLKLDLNSDVIKSHNSRCIVAHSDINWKKKVYNCRIRHMMDSGRPSVGGMFAEVQ